MQAHIYLFKGQFVNIIWSANSRNYFRASIPAFFVLVLSSLLSAPNSQAAEDKFTLSGFGYQDYRIANTNIYEGADSRGTWENGILALVMSANVSDNDTAWAQLETNPSQPTEFTWAFLDHRFNDDLSIHIGRIKMPYGLYNEYIDNKALQLSAIRPSSYSFQADMVHDAYQGIGVDWTVGSLFIQLMEGKIYTPVNNGAITDAFTGRDRMYLGSHITWNTPIEGLRFMFSSWDGQVEDNTGIQATPGLGPLEKETRRMYSVEYLTDRLDLKAEHNNHIVPPNAPHDSQPVPNCSVTVPGNPPTTAQCMQDAIPSAPSNTTVSWYVQAGYKFGPWTPYARYDYFVHDDSDPGDPGSYQKEWVFGVNYKIDANLNWRIEDHIIDGYGLAVATGDMSYGGGDTKWNMMATEINFKF